jgi:predicted DNA-binding transcriptional regulator YafY
MRLDVRFTPEAATHLTETPVSEDQKLGDDAEGRVRLRATVADTPQLRWWLLGFGDAVEVVGPAALREWFAQTTARMAKSYPSRSAGARNLREIAAT